MKRSSESIKTISPAILEAQKAIEAAIKTSTNPHFKSKFADFPDVVDAVKKPLNDNGIAFIQSVDRDEHGTFIETRLQHSCGEWIASYTPVLQKDASNPQHMGSGITYAKRYGLQAICGLPTEDDDGNTASKPMDPPKAQIQPVTDSKLKSDKSMAFIADKASAGAAVSAVKKFYILTAEQEDLVKRLWADTHSTEPVEDF